MKVSQTQITRTYSQEDIQQILHLAFSRQDGDEEFSREQLVEIASELGISTDSLQAAEQQWLTHHGDLQKRQAFNIYRRGKFQKYLGNYVIANSCLMGLNFLGSGQLSWSLYILLFWGMGLGLKAWNTYQSQGEDYERAFQNWHRKQQLHQSINGLFNRMAKIFQT